jgi:hypothetical protein
MNQRPINYMQLLQSVSGVTDGALLGYRPHEQPPNLQVGMPQRQARWVKNQPKQVGGLLQDAFTPKTHK